MTQELISLRVPDSIQEFPLTKESMVFIVGGWAGAHAKYYVDKYNCHVHIFEPQYDMAVRLVEMFAAKKKVQVHSFGLGIESGEFPLSRVGTDRCSFVHRLAGKDGDESTFEEPHGSGRLMEVEEFLKMAKIDKVDLCLINCEGYEFKLLPHLVQNELIQKFVYLMVQFHLHHEGSELMIPIRDMLSKTHDVRDDYEPAWIVWDLRDEGPPLVQPPKPKRKPRAKKV